MTQKSKKMLYRHVANVPVSDHPQTGGCVLRVYERLGGFKGRPALRVALDFAKDDKLMPDAEATSRARFAIDLSKIDGGFLAVTIDELKQMVEAGESLAPAPKTAVTRLIEAIEAIEAIESYDPEAHVEEEESEPPQLELELHRRAEAGELSCEAPPEPKLQELEAKMQVFETYMSMFTEKLNELSRRW